MCVCVCGCLVVFSVPSTARSFRDGTPFTVPCATCIYIYIYIYIYI